ncbi:MAG: DUF2797 domain-containing protein [Flavobacteriales bacterium]|nr:DUF2797 domain-containing protein [Flavobacteriales bacterium]
MKLIYDYRYIQKLSNLKEIKGQYLIFEGGKVLNIRNNEGYKVEIEV